VTYLVHPLLIDGRVVCMMRLKEPPQRRVIRVLDRFEGGPSREAITDERRVEGREPASDVRAIACEHARQTVRQAGFIMNQSPAMLDETLERSGVLIGWTPRLQLRRMFTDQFESALGIRGIILLAAGGQCFTKLGQHPRIDGVEDHVVILQECVDQAAFRLFQTDGNRTTWKSIGQSSNPVIDLLGPRPYDPVFFLFGRGRPSAEIVLRVCPVDAHQGGVICVMAHARASSPVHGLLATETCGLYCCESLRVKSLARQHLSIRWRNTAHPTARNALLSRPDDPKSSFVATGCMSFGCPTPPLRMSLLGCREPHD
jgi:hypothetical protein